METAANSSTVCLVGVPMDYGTHLRGVDMGPSAIRVAGLADCFDTIGVRLRDLGDVRVGRSIKLRKPPRKKNGRSVACGREIHAICLELMDRVTRILAAGQRPLVIGGDHSLAIGTLAGVSRYCRRARQKFGLLWVDAHGDCNTPQTSPSGNVHGMSLAIALGAGPRRFTDLAGARPMVDPATTVLFAARELDPGEKRNLRDLGVRVFTMREIDERGLGPCAREAIEIVCKGTDGFHLSFDMDAIDPDIVPGVGTPVEGGLMLRESYNLMEWIADSRMMRSCEVVEINPALDLRNRTAQTACRLLASAFGDTIL